MTVDIVGIGDQKIEYEVADNNDYESMDSYLVIAKKTIRTFGDRYRPGLSQEMINSEDAISNVATAIMLADWRWDPNYKSSTGKVRSKRAYRNQCAIWAIQAYVGRRVSSPKLSSLDKVIGNFDKDVSLHELIPSDHPGPDHDILQQEDILMLQRILKGSALTEQQERYVKLHYMEDWTLQEIANEAGTSREAVRQTVERGLDKIKRLGAGL